MSAICPAWKASIMAGLVSGEVRAYLVDQADYSQAAFEADTYLNEVPLGAFIGGGTEDADGRAYVVVPATKTVTAGTFNTSAASADFVNADNSADAHEVLLYAIWTGSAATSQLVAYIDNISVTPNGANITVDWNVAGIFTL